MCIRDRAKLVEEGRVRLEVGGGWFTTKFAGGLFGAGEERYYPDAKEMEEGSSGEGKHTARGVGGGRRGGEGERNNLDFA